MTNARGRARPPRRSTQWIAAALASAMFVLLAAPAEAAVVFRAAASGNAASPTIIHVGAGAVANRDNCGSITPSIPAGNVGDILIALVNAREDNATVTMTGWNQYFTDSWTGQDLKVFIFWRVATGGDPNTVTQSSTCNSIAARISRFRNVDTAAPIENNPITGGQWLRQNSDNVDTGTVTPTLDNSMLVVASFVNDDAFICEAGGWNASFETALNVSRDLALNLHYQTQATAGPASASNWSIDVSGATCPSPNSDENHGIIFALRPTPPSNNLTIAVPAGTVAGDVMIASVTTTPSTITINPPTNWTLIREVTQSVATSSKLATYYRVATATEPASYTWTMSGGTHGGAVGGIMSFSGVDVAAPVDAENGVATGSSTNHTAPTITTTLPDGMLVTVHEHASASTWSPPGGMTEAVDVASRTPENAAGISMEMNYEVRLTAGATGPRTATASANADSGATQSISLKPTPLVCFSDDFTGPDDSPPSAEWVVSNSGGSYGNPRIFNNRLRMTNTAGNLATLANLQRLFPGSGNRIEVEFEHFAYGGSGADGIAVIFSDGAVTPSPGAYGGSLGYAQRTTPSTVNGFSGGWLAVGIDEYGNFSNPTEGRIGGPGFIVDSVSIRGSGSGTSDYRYHAGTATLSPQVDNNGGASPPHKYRIIVDHSNAVNAMVSVERNTGSGYVMIIPPYDAKAQAFQAAVPTNWIMSYTGSSGGSTNIHEIDSLRICATSQTPIAAIHHFDITVAASASTCVPQNVTITAKDSSNNTVTDYTGTITLSTSSGHGGWAKVVAGGTLTETGTNDDGGATYQFVVGDAGVITLSLSNTHADDLTIGVVDGAVPSTASNSTTVNFRDSAFVITPDTIQIAGRNQNMTAALYTRVGGGCSIDANYTGAKNLDAWLTLDTDHPAGATLPTIGALTLPTTAPAPNPGSNNLSLSFTAGSASFAMSTTDVGKYTLNLRDDTRLYANAVDLSGATTSVITTRPWLHVAVPGNPGVNTPGGAIFTSAGTSFTVNVRGVLWSATDDGNNDGVVDGGADLSDNSAAPRFAWDTTLAAGVPFTPATPADSPPGTAAPGGLNNGSILQAAYSGGAASRADINYTEVGSFTLTGSATNYLNSAGVNLSHVVMPVGRFRPAYFHTVLTAHGCVAGSYTYSGQPFSATVTAYNALAGVTQNFHGPFGFAKDTTLSNVGATDPGTFTNNTLLANVFSSGVGTQNVTYTFTAKETEPTTIVLRANDTETPPTSSAGQSEASVLIRSGRIRILNANGSELNDLAMIMRAEYYHTTDGWVRHTSDSCSNATLQALSNFTGNLALGETCVQDNGIGSGISTQGCAGAGPIAEQYRASPDATTAEYNLYLKAPGLGNEGSVDVTANLTAPLPWLRYNWDGVGGEDSPTGRATFGTYRGSPVHIYLRERY